MSDRKYKQRGYQDTDGRPREPRQEAPRQPRDMTGPRTPRFPARVTVARCANCGSLLAKGFDPTQPCAKCGFELHSCKQCLHFDTGARWECTQPIPARVSPKDARNYCTLYAIRMSSERETTTPQSAVARPDDPRKAFENLFKK